MYDFSTLYPRFRDFAALRHQLDPHRVFCNAFLDSVFPEPPTAAPTMTAAPTLAVEMASDAEARRSKL
jgi:hypothetical protein